MKKIFNSAVLAVAVTGAALLSGCTGPSTQVLPQSGEEELRLVDAEIKRMCVELEKQKRKNGAGGMLWWAKGTHLEQKDPCFGIVYPHAVPKKNTP